MRNTALALIALTLSLGCSPEPEPKPTYFPQVAYKATSMEEELAIIAAEPCMIQMGSQTETIADVRQGSPLQIRALLIGAPFANAVRFCE